MATQPARSSIFTAQVTALFLSAIGWGWNSGTQAQPITAWWGIIADIMHMLPLVILVPLSLSFINAAVAGKVAPRGIRNSITALALFATLVTVVFVVLGIIFPDPNAVGVHTFEDAMPAIVMNAGTLLWLVTLVASRRSAGVAPLAERVPA